VVLFVLGVLVLYLVPPLVIESLIAGRLQTQLETSTKPEVKVSSSFPPMMLLGSIDQVQLTSKQIILPDGEVVHDARVDMSGVSVSVPSLIVGKPAFETESCFVEARDYEYQECPPELSGASSS
jgi:hypothetical protein